MATAAPGVWRYRLYGLELQSDHPLEPLPCVSAAAAPDVIIEFAGIGRVERPPGATLWYATRSANPERAGSSLWAWECAEGTYLHLRYAGDDDHADFVLNPRSDHVRAYWTENAREEDVITFLLGPVLGTVLRRRGITCLHASTVALGDHAFAISGPSGAGKSTVAAALARIGLATLGDEIAVLSETPSSFVVYPGEPRLRLSSSTAEKLCGSAGELQQVLPGMDKRWLLLRPAAGAPAWRHHDSPLPLAAIYIIGQRSNRGEIRIEPFSWTVATMMLASQLYLGAFMTSVQRSAEFARLGRLAARVPVRRLHMPEGLARVEEGAAALIENARAAAPA